MEMMTREAVAECRKELSGMEDALEKAFQSNLVLMTLSHSPQEIKNALIQNGIDVPDWLEAKCS